ncbi:MAG: hypothetical protein K2X81_20115 [Candidatus Obscuribacterales bacterium]|nr:hypothetical protein [Candidatus Obscuribacterales bacterium]
MLHSETRALSFNDTDNEIRDFMVSGKDAYQQGAYSQSESLFLKAMEKARSISSKNMEIYAHAWLINAYSSQGKLKEAESLCNQELASLKSSPPHYMVKELCVLAAVQVKAGKRKDAEYNYQKAKKLADDKDCDTSYRAAPLLGLAAMRSDENRLQDAELLWEQGLDLLENNNVDFQARVPAIKGMAKIYEVRGQTGKAEKVFKNAISDYEINEKDNANAFATTLYGFATLLTKNERSAEALSMFKQAHEIFQKYGNSDKSAKSCSKDYAALLKKSGHAEQAKMIEESK